MMITLQGVIILRVTDFRRFFDWEEFWIKKDSFIALWRNESYRKFFVNNEKEYYLVLRFYEWLLNPNKELQKIKLESTELKIENCTGDTLVYPLGRLQDEIEKTKKQNQLTNKTIIGYTLLYLLLGAKK